MASPKTSSTAVPGQDRSADLALEREHLFAGETIGSGVSEQVLASWRRCLRLGIDPDRAPALYKEEVDVESRLVQAAAPVLDQLGSRLGGLQVGVLLCDEKARLLTSRAASPELRDLLDELPALPGRGFDERIFGTNGVGTVVIEGRPTFIRGREHFVDSLRTHACAGSPIRDPISGTITGVLDLTCLDRNADPGMLAQSVKAAGEIERRLFEQASVREQALARAFLDARRRSRGAYAGLAAPDGGPAGVNVPIAQLLSRRDRHRLLEEAAELISLGQVGVTVVPLSEGAVATLLSHEVEDAAGVRGIAVEAVLDDGLSWRVASATDLGAPRIPAGPEAGSLVAARPGEGPGVPVSAYPPRTPEQVTRPDLPDAAADRWLVAVGEPGIGRLAVQARDRLGLLFEAGARIGGTLEVTRTAEELTEVAVPRFADYVAVDVADCVLRGEEPDGIDTSMVRIALGGVREGTALFPVGELFDLLPSTPQARSLAVGRPVLEPDLTTAGGWSAQAPALCREALAAGVHSLVAAPMRARGVTLGVVSFYRSRDTVPFEDDDLSLAAELVGRAAVCVDNARRYTREHMISAELEWATESLGRSLDRQRRFTTDASHELRTPLAGLRAQLEEAQLHPDDTDIGDLLKHTLGDVDRLEAILTDLLLLAQIGSVQPSEREHVDFAELVAAEAGGRIGDRHPVRLDLQPGVIVDVVPSRFGRLLRNLLDNAQRHATETIAVQVRQADGVAELSVTDDGPGVPEEEREHIFERFARLDSARSRDRGGTGLGLAIARDIVHAAQGTLHVEDAPPHGARFVVRLPIAHQDAAQGRPGMPGAIADRMIA
jgi:signal transduction histidine kinase